MLPFCPDAGGSAGLIHKVNGLIRQAAPRQIPHGELHGFPQGLRRQLDTVIPLIAGCQPLQNAHSLLRSRLFDLHFAKAAFEGGVFLDMGAKFLIGGGPDELQLAPGQHRFQDAGRINGSLGSSCPHDGVELVHKQNRAAIPDKFLQQVFKALLKIAPVLGACHQAGHIQRQQPPPLQHPGHIFVGNALGQPLCQRSLPHAGLPHEAGVIFLAAAQDLHHPVQLFFPAEHRVQLPICRPAGQVTAVFIAGAAAPRHGRSRARLQRQDELAGQLAAFPHRLRKLDPHGSQQHPGRAIGILQHGAEQVLRFRFRQMSILCPDERVIHGAFEVWRQRFAVQMQRRALPVGPQLTPDGQLRDIFPGQELRRRAVVGLEHCQQQVASIRFFAAKPPGQLYRLVQQQPCLPGEPFVSALAECFPNAHVLPLPPFWYPAEV